MKKILNHPRSIIFKWLISYVLILVIPLFIFLLIMFQFVNILDGEINYSNTMLLKQLQLQMDSIVYDAKEMSAEISIDTDLQQLSDDTNDVSAYGLSQIVNDLGKYSIVKNQPIEFYAYYFQRDLIINNYRYCNSQFFYDTYLKDTGIDSNQWNKIITTRYSSITYTTLSYIDSNNKKSSKIVMITPLLVSRGSESYGNVVVMFDGTELLEKELALQGLKRENVLILNSDNKLLYNNIAHQSTGISLKYDALQSDTDTVFNDLSTNDEIVSYISSKVTRWEYIVAVPKKTYQSKMIDVQNSMLVGLLLCFVIGGLSIVMVLRNNYSPVSKMVKAAEKYTDQPVKDHNNHNEFQYITNVIDEIQSENVSITNILQSQKEKLRSQILLQLLENRNLAEKPTAQDLEHNDIHFQSDCFFVLLYSIHDFSQLFGQQNGTLDDVEKYKLASLIIQNVTEELLGDQQMKTFYFHTSNLIGFIVNPEETDETKAMSIITDQVEKANLFFDKNYNLGYIAACSEMQISWENLPQAYAHALKVLEYKETLDIEDILFYQDIKENSNENVLYYPSETEMRISNAIKAGDSDQACAIIQEVMDKNLKNNLTPETIRYLVLNITGTLIKTVNQMNSKMQTALPEVSFHAMMQSGNVSAMTSDIQKAVKNVCQAVSEWLSQNNSSQSKALYEKALEFVDENYMDENLNVGLITQKFDVHMVYLSRIFTEYYGDSLSSYINKVRLKHAKEMMNSDQTLEEISKAVGYNNIRTFMRVFKKYEGTTPGKYKKINAEENGE